MNVKRYVAKTAKEALAKVRVELGPDAVVLKNRPVPGGVEILAMADEAALALGGDGMGRPDTTPPARAGAAAAVADDDADEPMSTVSFEAYVRERQQRRMATEAGEPAESAEPAGAGAEPDRATRFRQRPERAQSASAQAGAAPSRGSAPSRGVAPGRGVAQSQGLAQAQEMARAAMAQAEGMSQIPGMGQARATLAPPADDAIDARALLSELRAMRGFISDQLESMSWFEGVRRRPVQSRMLRRLLQRGFSAALVICRPISPTTRPINGWPRPCGAICASMRRRRPCSRRAAPSRCWVPPAWARPRLPPRSPRSSRSNTARSRSA
ncbi:MAG: hypothetical protein ABT05_07200 [Lautropia sp. SCN 66-9]|nr:MAG: hypothetical protein ABT05_07200 [Lautropia sp. SCN 66-9]